MPNPTAYIDPRRRSQRDTEIRRRSVPFILILITPCTGSATFQNGYLGADNEHCSIEGELQIKGAGSFDLESVYVHSHV